MGGKSAAERVLDGPELHRPALEDRRGHTVPAVPGKQSGRARDQPEEGRVTLAEAHESFLADRKASGLCESTLRGYESIFRQWAGEAAATGKDDLADWDAAALRKWREGWGCSAGTHRQRLSKIKAFCTYAVHEGWIDESPARRLRAPKETAMPTMPLSVTEMHMLVLAAGADSERVRAFVLLMRYSGLSIQDAATLARDRLDGTLLTLRRGKSGELVQVDLPELVVEALQGLPVEGRHYFWTGKSAPVTVAKLWGKRLRSVAAEAKVDNFRSHRLRDTFAVGLLLAGVSMEDVSVLLGHSSIRTTERFYAPWNKSRRDRLVRVVRETFGKDQLLELLCPSNDGRGVWTVPHDRDPEDVA